MPIFDYECQCCHNVTERVVKSSDDIVTCELCLVNLNTEFKCDKVYLKPPTWKFADMKDGKWNGDSSKMFK